MPYSREAIEHEKGIHPNHYTIGEFADRLGVSKDTIERKIQEGKIPDAKIRTKTGWRLWAPDVVRAALNMRQTGAL